MSDWFAGAGNGAKVQASVMLDTKAWEMLQELISQGAMVTFAMTSDGGALGLTLTVDGRWRREYFRDPEQLELWVEEAMAPVLAACEVRNASGAGAQRSRRSRGA